MTDLAPLKYQTQRNKGEERRQRILGVALALLARQGGRDTTLAEVAEQAGVSQAGLLHHFPSKEHLLHAVLDIRDSRGWTTPNPEEVSLRLVDTLRSLGRRFVHEPELVGLFNTLVVENISPDAPLHGRFLARYRETTRRFTEAIVIGQRRGEIRANIDPELKAAEIVAFLNGMEITWLLDPEIKMVEVFDQYAEALRRDLAVTEEKTKPL